jgi:hypothetical protein
MRLLRPSRCRAALAGAAVALGLITVTAAAAMPAMAATSSASHMKPDMAGNSSYNQLSKAAQGRLISSPLGMHTAGMTSRLCSTSTAHWVTLHINYDNGRFLYYCFGGTGTWYFISNVIAWACSGNNSGALTWFPGSGSGPPQGKNFGPGWTLSFGPGVDAQYVTIRGWSGSYNC